MSRGKCSSRCPKYTHHWRPSLDWECMATKNHPHPTHLQIKIHKNASPSSETQGQIKGARKSLNGRKNIYGTKKSKEWREKPLGTMSYQTSSKRSPPFWLLISARKLVFFWHQSEARTAATVWNWSGKTSSPGALLAVLYFSSCHIFPPV